MGCNCNKAKTPAQPNINTRGIANTRSMENMTKLQVPSNVTNLSSSNIRAVLKLLHGMGDTTIEYVTYNGNTSLVQSPSRELQMRFRVAHYGAAKKGDVIPVLSADVDGVMFLPLVEVEEVEEVDEVSTRDVVEPIVEPVVEPVYPEGFPKNRYAVYDLYTTTDKTVQEIAELTDLSVGQVNYAINKYELTRGE